MEYGQIISFSVIKIILMAISIVYYLIYLNVLINAYIFKFSIVPFLLLDISYFIIILLDKIVEMDSN